MTKETRIENIQKIIERDKSKEGILREEVMWEGKLEAFPVFNIPLTYLVYNKYNGRILSRTKSLEKQNKLIDVETNEGRDLIEKLLWESKLDRNKKTEDDLKLFGQKRIGIITKDGVIIDGNRRAMLLNRLDRTRTFKAIVLPVSLEENPIEIERLETSYQMGEDEKVGYNPIEKYLKAREIYLKLRTTLKHDEAVERISKWMGSSISEIERYLSIMKVMDLYLEYLDYNGIYTQLDEREDQFISLTKWLDTFYDKESNKAFDGYFNDDVDDLRDIAFDFLRFKNKFDGKEFRFLADGQRDKHLFGDKEIWESFRTKHHEIVSNLPPEPSIDFSSNNLQKHLDQRDELFYESSKLGGDTSAFLENFKEHRTRVEYNKAADAPEKLVKRASQAFSAIKQGHSSFSSKEVQSLVKDFGKQVINSLQKKSPLSVLDYIIETLEEVDFSNVKDEEVDDLKTRTKKIQQLGYNLQKSL